MPAVELPFERTLVFAPHPDDESVGPGALLAHIAHSGGVVRVVYMTDGENNPWPQRACRRRWRITARDRDAWGRLRRREAGRALRVLGVSAACAKFLAFPDDGVAETLRHDRDRLVERVTNSIREFQPTLLIVPSIEDLHGDHRATHRAVLRALFPSDVPKPQLALAYIVHGQSKSDERLTFDVCDADLDRKRRAIDCHRTQLFLSRHRFLGYATRKEEFVPVKIVTVREESRAAKWEAKVRHAISVMR